MKGFMKFRKAMFVKFIWGESDVEESFEDENIDMTTTCLVVGIHPLSRLMQIIDFVRGGLTS